ncbi:MAG TPA: hypothetical protein VM841_14015 [Actinomycetota bacterium]|nr:hypothetical protein [Actinomycetota bacterium]
MADFVSDLETLGFRRTARRVPEWTHQASPYLIFSVQAEADGYILFTWELAIGEFMHAHGLQIGTNEALNLFLFPERDSRGPADVTFVVDEMDRVRKILSSLDLSR